MPFFFRYIFSLIVPILLLISVSSEAQTATTVDTAVISDSTDSVVDTAHETIQNSESVSPSDSTGVSFVKTEQSDSTTYLSTEKPESAPSTSGWYNGYSRSQRGGRGVSSGGGPVEKKDERRRIADDSLPAVKDTTTLIVKTDTLPVSPQDSTRTFSLHTMSTRSKIIAGVSSAAIIGGVITFFLVKKIKDQIPEPTPLPEPPSPPDF